jgi:acyl carrier protein
LWEEVLGIQGLGVNDSFIALGGNSLIAIQLVTRIRNLFEIEVPIAAFYRQPTIEGVARALVRHLINGVDASLLEEMIDALE